MQASNSKKYLFAFTLLSTIALNGCQVVSLKQQAVDVTIANERNSILTQKKLSEASLNVLSMSGKEAKICMQSPNECIADLHKIPQIQDEQLLSTASELYLAKAVSLSDSSECKISKLSKHKPADEQKLIQQNYESCLDKKLEAFNEQFEEYEAGKYVEWNSREWEKLSVSGATVYGVKFEDLFNTININ